MYKYPANVQSGDGSSIPLLSKMADDKLKVVSPDVTDISRDSEANSTDSIIEKNAAPWWSYVWVGLLEI
jgi:hypothetical protein